MFVKYSENNLISRVMRAWLKLYILQRLPLVIMSIAVTLGLSLSPISNVFATSAYDDAVNTVSSLQGYDYLNNPFTITPTDISTVYAAQMADACGVTVYDSFLSAATQGGHYVVMQESGNEVRAIWEQPGQSTTLQFVNNSYTAYYNDLVIPQGWDYYGFADWNTDPYSGSPAHGSCVYSTTTYEPYSQPGAVISQSNLSAAPIGVYRNTFPINYPSGYAGTWVPMGNTTPVTGEIECFNNNDIVSSVHVSPSSGLAGNAVLTTDSNGYLYVYYPTESISGYNLSIKCGDETQNTYPSTASPSDSGYIWYCDRSVDTNCYNEGS
jgi:hypothetical protein